MARATADFPQTIAGPGAPFPAAACAGCMKCGGWLTNETLRERGKGGIVVSDLTKTPITVITGFLGAGKTTILRQLMLNSGGKRLAVLVNEFGSDGVDGEILKGCADAACPAENIIELANGCICCTVADDFIPAIEGLLALPQPPEHILVETSGLALPKPLLKALDWPRLRSRITVDGVVALADAEAVANGRFAHDTVAVARQREADDALDHDTPLSEVFEDQINCADMVVLTKTDLVDSTAEAAARGAIAAISARQVPVINAVDGMIDHRLLLGIGAGAEGDIDARPSHHDGAEDHEHDDFTTITVDIPESDNPDLLLRRVAAAARSHGILRVKGHVAISGKPFRLLVQAVGDRVRSQFDGPWADRPRKGSLVVIGQSDGFDASAITRAIAG